jgi:hypothetical protein
MTSRVAPLALCGLLILATRSTAARGAPAPSAEPRPPERLAHFDQMPKVVLLPDGALAAYFLQHRGPGLPMTEDVQRMRVRHSKDHGKTWDESREIFALPRDAGGFGYFERLIDKDGEVHFFLLCDANTGVVRMREKTATQPAVEPLTRQSLDVWHVRSTNGRTKWSTPKEIWKGRAGDLQSVIQLKNGRLVLPLSYLVPRSWGSRGEGFNAFMYMGQFDTTALYSDDGGSTWTKSASVLRTPTPNLSAYGAVEPVVIELKDGRVWMLLRTQLGRFWESFSADGGATWSPAQPTTITSSDSPAGLVRLPDERMLLIWNNCLRYPYAQGARNVLHGAVSGDEGKTWRGYREIARDPKRLDPPPPTGDHGVSYPFASPTADGRVIYSLWVETGEGRSLFAVDPTWLDETTQHDDFASGEIEPWSTYGTKGAELVSADGAKDGKALAIRKADSDWPCAAVRNFPGGASGSVKLRVLMEPGFGGASIQLTDHFSVPFDLEDWFFSTYELRAGPDGPIKPGRWTDVELRWDGDKRAAQVLVDGRTVSTLAANRAGAPLSYLRIRPLCIDQEKARLLVDEVHVEVKP